MSAHKVPAELQVMQPNYKKYCSAKAQAKRRNINFELSFEEWLAIWIESGKWELRGRTKGCYGMGMTNAVLGYVNGNVYIDDRAEIITKEMRQKTYVYKAGVYRSCHHIWKHELEDYLANGWSFGKGPYTPNK